MSETVEVVIRLPKDIYDIFVKNAETIKANPLSFQTINAVLNGTVLPKGHGRLIDADAILEEPYGNTYKDINIAETIIEADKDGE